MSDIDSTQPHQTPGGRVDDDQRAGDRADDDQHAASRAEVTGSPRFVDRDLAGAHFERVDLRAATLEQVHLDGASLNRVALDGAMLRAVSLTGVQMRGVELVDVDISGDLLRVRINGVDVAPLVEAELNRRHPERPLLFQSDPASAQAYRDGWAQLEQAWAGTIERARALPAGWEHRGVDGEWSIVQTLRHVSFAIAAWIERMVVGTAAPWHPLDLPWDEAPGWPDIPWDRDARPCLDEVVALWERRRDTVRELLAGLTDERLRETVTRQQPGWPQLTDFPLRECVHIAVTEVWEHRQFAERDLDRLAELVAEPND